MEKIFRDRMQGNLDGLCGVYSVVKPERGYRDVYDAESATFANGDYFNSVNAKYDLASVEVFKGQLDLEHLIATQYCVARRKDLNMVCVRTAGANKVLG